MSEGLGQPIAFSADAEAALRSDGWTIVEVPAGLTLGVLRGLGAPFRGERYFREFALDVVEVPTIATAAAYKPGFLPGSLNLVFDAAARLVEEFDRVVPRGSQVALASAATYVHLLWQHARRTGGFPIAGYFTWTSDVSPAGHLVVGVFGRDRPLVVAPHAQSGAGVGVLPVLVPRG
jgi:hypothetical protein